MLLWPFCRLTTRKPVLAAGQLLGELLPIVAEISRCPRPRAADARHRAPAAADRRLPDPGHLPSRARRHPGPRVRRGIRQARSPGACASGPARASWARPPSRKSPLFVPDVSQDPRYLSVVPGVRAELAIPLIHRDRLVGVLNVEGPRSGRLHPEARAALLVLAGHLAIAIENATLYREARWYAGLLATLYEIGKETSSILDLDELLQRVAEVVKRVIDYEMFGILLLDEEKASSSCARRSPTAATKEKKTRIRLGEGLTGAAALSKQPILVGDVRQRPALPRPHPGDALRAGGAARPQGPRGGRLRPRVLGARPLHRGARQGPDAARQPGGGGHRGLEVEHARPRGPCAPAAPPAPSASPGWGRGSARRPRTSPTRMGCLLRAAAPVRPSPNRMRVFFSLLSP